MATDVFTDRDAHELLVAVGLAPDAGNDSYERSFEALGLDSLARVEMASRIGQRYGVDVEEDLTPELTPVGMTRLVNERLGARA